MDCTPRLFCNDAGFVHNLNPHPDDARKNAGTHFYNAGKFNGVFCMNYLFAAYSAIWFLFFIYLFTLKSRQRNLEKTLSLVEKKLGL